MFYKQIFDLSGRQTSVTRYGGGGGGRPSVTLCDGGGGGSASVTRNA